MMIGRTSSGSTDDDTGPPHMAGFAVASRPDEHLYFDTFYAAHFQRLSLQLYAYTSDVAQAQDVVQEAFCRALTRWDRIARYDDPLAWVRRVAWNVATSRIRHLRVTQAHARRQRQQHIDGPSPDRVMLARALATLPDKHRRAVVLFHLADLSITAIAEHEGVPEGTVKAWLHRGRAALAVQLSDLRMERPDA